MSAESENPDRGMFTKETTVEEVLEKHPELVGVFMDLNVRCVVCGEPLWGTIEEAARTYGVDLDILLRRLNDAVGGK